jgi:hypothetical protein
LLLLERHYWRSCHAGCKRSASLKRSAASRKQSRQSGRQPAAGALPSGGEWPANPGIATGPIRHHPSACDPAALHSDTIQFVDLAFP